MADQQQQQSPLLRLPVELQLIIYELAVVEKEVLLLNCPCDSSYPDDEEAWWEASDEWRTGAKHAPYQPAITRTCAGIRKTALKMFYERNVFRAHYCVEANLEYAVKWLKTIGPENRRALNDLAFWDLNPDYDEWCPRYAKLLQRCDICRSMGGVLRSTSGSDHTCHRVSFKDVGEDKYLELVAGLFESSMEVT